MEEQKNIFPVNNLNGKITKILTGLIPQIYTDLKDDDHFDKKIDLIDDGNKISSSNFAEIRKIEIDGLHKVKLSIAYCQFFWLICDVCLKTIDHKIIEEECRKNKISISEYVHNNRKILEPFSRERVEYIQYCILNDLNFERIESYFKSSLDISNKDFHKVIKEEWKLAFSLVDPAIDLNLEDFSKINMKGDYVKGTNQAYCYGIAFILFHELSHYKLGHCQKNDATMSDEEGADDCAFWDIYSNVEDEEKFSVNVGMICVLFSFIFYDPEMKPDKDNVHPREDKRLFDIYKNIKNDNQKYTILIIELFNKWGKHFKIKGYPSITDKDESAIKEIESFLQSKTVFEVLRPR